MNVDASIRMCDTIIMNTVIQEIDARALRLGITVTALAKQAGVSTGTMAKLHKGLHVQARPVNKLIAKLEEMEASK